jgi:putative tryptophan/tyrosine transport system substrate-binding protein
VKRRAFISLLGGAAAAWPFAARAQQAVLPVIGLLSGGSPQPHLLEAFHRSLKETGFIQGQNVKIEYRWANGEYDRLLALAAELVGHKVAVIAAANTPAALAAQAATRTTPIIFSIGIDPAEAGVVESLSRPGGNATGAYFLTTSLEAKRLQLLHEAVPTATVIGVIVNPTYSGAASQLKDAHEGASALGLELRVLDAKGEREIEAAFASAVEQRIGALLVGSDVLFFRQRKQFIALAARHAIPAIFYFAEFARDGGLMSYGASLTDAYHLIGNYAGRILKGEKPADLPVQQSTRVEFVINLKTANALGLTIPLPLLGRADEVIE